MVLRPLAAADSSSKTDIMSLIRVEHCGTKTTTIVHRLTETL